MQHFRIRGRAVSLSATLLIAASVAIAAPAATARRSAPKPPVFGVAGAYLDGRFALSQADYDHAADQFLKALAIEPASAELVQQAFTASLMIGRPEAARLAKELPNNFAAQLLLAD